MALKLWIHVDSDDGEPQRVCWYEGTSDVMVENAVRMLLHLPRESRFLLRDSDGDLVPVSGTLPHDQIFHLVAVDDGSSSTVSPPYYPNSSQENARGLDQNLCRPHTKRRRVEQSIASAEVCGSRSPSDADVVQETHREDGSTQLSPAPTSIINTTQRTRSMVHLVKRFLETFTCAIPNDDNVNFIPSTGPFALFALYCHLFRDPVYHPKGQNSFYKLTSSQGKVDRQRVKRYFQCPANRLLSSDQAMQESDDALNSISRSTVVMYRPEGKGPLLRRYIRVGTDISAADLVRAASFVSVLSLDPRAIVSQYAAFLDGFEPISKAAFLAQIKAHATDSSL